MNVLKSLTLVLVIQLIVGCNDNRQENQSKVEEQLSKLDYSNREIHKDPDSSVTVELSSARISDGLVIRAVFTPPEGFRFYDKDMPRNGIGEYGSGRPTLIELAEAETFQKSLLISPAKAVEKTFPEFGLTFSVYDPGPITLYLTLQKPIKHVTSLKLFITHMACNDKVCKKPLEQAMVEIAVPELEAAP